MFLTYRANQSGTLQAAYRGAVRIGYIEHTGERRWIWSLNTIQPRGGRASSVVETEDEAKDALSKALVEWLEAAGLEVSHGQ